MFVILEKINYFGFFFVFNMKYNKKIKNRDYLEVKRMGKIDKLGE